MRLARARTAPTRPTVTVVVPCYNYGHFLPACVDSALGQEGVEVDVIIVDDCSPDGSVAVANALAASDPRISVIAHAQNAGHIRTYNDGLARATGTYVVLLSADDLLTPGSLARSTALMEANPGVGLAYGNPLPFEDEVPQARTAVTSWSLWSGRSWLQRMCARGHNMILCPEAVMRTAVLRDIGGYDPRLPHSADMLMWMRAAARADVGRVNGADQGFYRQHSSNMHHQVFGAFLSDLRERQLALEIFFEEDGRLVHRPEALQRRAFRTLARDARDQGRDYLDGGGDDLDVYGTCRRIAAELSPSSRWRPGNPLDTLRTRRAERRQRPSVVQRCASIGRALTWKYRWQRWYRLGT